MKVIDNDNDNVSVCPLLTEFSVYFKKHLVENLYLEIQVVKGSVREKMKGGIDLMR